MLSGIFLVVTMKEISILYFKLIDEGSWSFEENTMQLDDHKQSISSTCVLLLLIVFHEIELWHTCVFKGKCLPEEPSRNRLS